MSAVLDEGDDHEVLVRDHLSWSAISCYRTCPLKYYFRYVARLGEESVSASLLFGGAIHRSLAHYFTAQLQGLTHPGLDRLLEEYQAHWLEHRQPTVRFGANESQVSLLGLARRMLGSFLESPLARPRGQILAVEETLSGQLLPGAPRFVGVVDLILVSPSELILLDWKTSRGRWSELQLAEAEEQLLLYAELARTLAPTRRIRLQPVVLTKTKSPIVESYPLSCAPDKLQRTKNCVAAVWRAVQAEHFYPTPSVLACGSCAFRKACRDWQGPAVA